MRFKTPLRSTVSAWVGFVAAAGLGLLMSGCASGPVIIPPSEQPLPSESMMLLGKKGMETTTPIYIRIFKEESELEVWKARADGRFYHFKTYPICNWSGDLGPKQAKGDKQAPEGFYSITAKQLKPDSSYYLAFNLGFPNAYDRAHGRTGEFLMIHGKCKSAGCYAMTDALVEEIYALGREALRGGQQAIPVHAFPFRMTDEKLARHRANKWHAFWRTMKEGYDSFEVTRVPPTVAVCEKRYMVNVVVPPFMDLNPEGACPRFEKPALTPFAAAPADEKLALERVTIVGPKTRGPGNISIPPADPIASAIASSSRMPSPEAASALGYRQ
jgi:murein L,D-transpeptidase YafK